jgi:uncharacterized membrane protein YhaH (DUF805 family)
MTFAQAIKTVLAEKYATFSGRAGRSEYWWFTLFASLVFLPLYFWAFPLSLEATAPLFNTTGLIVLLLAAAALFVPQLALGVRRLHDIGLSGWWMLLTFVPLASTALVVLALVPSGPDNQYGPGRQLPAAAAPAGWYAAPADPAPQRYWDGGRCTDHTARPAFL